MPFCKGTQEPKHNFVVLLFKLRQPLLCFQESWSCLKQRGIKQWRYSFVALYFHSITISLDFEGTMMLSFVIIIVSSTDVLERNRCPQISPYFDSTKMKWQRPDFRFHCHFSIIGCLKIKIIQHYNLLWHLLNMKFCLKHDALPFK